MARAVIYEFIHHQLYKTKFISPISYISKLSLCRFYTDVEEGRSTPVSLSFYYFSRAQ